ncbi:MAG: molybdate ABC transporter substrate-binding protein [Methanocorpusculum sp.]|jgi:molybdate transport system substrate-binding protein|nr:molybdate ABC transporter substrate-binding protein [Methanocorpusculum sp.]MDD2470293.1 molybdate ABC transporter substrate-binding protein [Methanocorpusculum sp.]MDD3257105.1 molybdate ABC transporter substrate-binding protein [Methanocorpusculum sp.]MDD4132909.1 molybdate ABC transporter substrate-binding protein [Methanocorpusculum sp.]
MKKSILFASVVCLILLTVVCSAGCVTEEKNYDGQNLLVYSGAGLKGPMAEIGTTFGEKYNVNVELTYGGSGVLISQMTTTKLGDIFIPGGEPDYQNAVAKGLVSEDYQPVAYHVPVIAVSKGNPKGIETVEDLATPGLRVALGDVNATAIGKASAAIFKKAGILESVEQNVVLRGATINEVVTALSTGNADAAVLTLDSANKDLFTTIEIPVKDNSILITPIGVTTFTTKSELAQLFADYVASDEGKAIFEKYGFPAYPDAKYT